MEYEVEKLLKCNAKIFFINVVKAYVLVYRKRSKKFYRLTRMIYDHRKMGGWRQQTIYVDVIWTVIIAVKYCSSSFFADMIAEQIIKRQKQ